VNEAPLIITDALVAMADHALDDQAATDVTANSLDGFTNLLIIGMGVYFRLADPTMVLHDEAFWAMFPNRLSAFGYWLETRYPSLGDLEAKHVLKRLMDLITDYQLELLNKPYKDRN
jgi:hypothetical protein